MRNHIYVPQHVLVIVIEMSKTVHQKQAALLNLIIKINDNQLKDVILYLLTCVHSY